MSLGKPIPGKGHAIATVELRNYAPGDEHSIVQILTVCHDQGWKDEGYWRWKHLARLDFNRQDIVIADVNGKMVGCFHGALFPIRIEAGLDVLMSLDGDFAVLPEYRGTGIPTQAHDLCDQRLLERGAVLRGGFTSQELNKRFYHKHFGYVFVPAVTTTFRKIIGLRPLQRKVERLGTKLLARCGLRRALCQQPLVVDIRLDTFPPCYLELTEQVFRLCNGGAQQPHLRVWVPYSLLVALDQGPRPVVTSIIVNLLKGRLRISGLIRKSHVLLKLLWLCAWKVK